MKQICFLEWSQHILIFKIQSSRVIWNHLVVGINPSKQCAQERYQLETQSQVLSWGPKRHWLATHESTNRRSCHLPLGSKNGRKDIWPYRGCPGIPPLLAISRLALHQIASQNYTKTTPLSIIIPCSNFIIHRCLRLISQLLLPRFRGTDLTKKMWNTCKL